ncbi:hypothetical protein CTAYLR_001803 [Chrysophaeum taylorii]|uniref:Uncharacterized protein n=1 Tax=Chrysophaeum taylorii TaxID=2483200 RepID=A0AAD7U8Y5_9STRA|nr:hypothetical protein CTAYLR_001803 [Chrysophaeum taylorii]
MERKHVLITGSSRGLGLEFVRQFLGRGAIVHATCRSPSSASALEALKDEFGDKLKIYALDTSVEGSAVGVASQIESLDVLVNNAGIATKHHPVDPIVENDIDELMTVVRTNVGGNIATTNAFLDALRRGSKIVVNLSSDLGSIEKTFQAQSTTVKAGGVSSYRISKAASNMATRIFAAELASENFKVIALSPGWVATDMGASGGRAPPLTPEQSIRGCIDVISKLTSEDNGKFFGFDGANLPW